MRHTGTRVSSMQMMTEQSRMLQPTRCSCFEITRTTLSSWTRSQSSQNVEDSKCYMKSQTRAKLERSPPLRKERMVAEVAQV